MCIRDRYVDVNGRTRVYGSLGGMATKPGMPLTTRTIKVIFGEQVAREEFEEKPRADLDGVTTPPTPRPTDSEDSRPTHRQQPRRADKDRTERG
eukprot:793564-Alexandrium_andersonii.AAC.1